ncbi:MULTISPECIES: DUF4440 domain-containing protein [unclassified Anaeromyxobacter]|uniref:DUF4440 domain-containing protein n=2 Tax=unclassified Anaeromyxobacter TaxID=2620896 RepID=UPI001F571341|nr:MULTISPECIES: DUF4440 domain-containing protein [unclassified Anaeromyxobacter]
MMSPVRFLALLSLLVPIAVLGQGAGTPPAPTRPSPSTPEPSTPPPGSAEPATPAPGTPAPGAAEPSAPAPSAAEPAPSHGKDMGEAMAGWTPRKVTPAQEKQGQTQITALLKKLQQASQKGELDAAAALVDFPVLMVTDNKAGDGVGGPWNEEQWRKMMEPVYGKPMKDLKMTHAPKIFLVSDALATVDDNWTMTMGKKKTTGRSALLLVRKGGEWKIKAMIEGGWGDMPGVSEGQGAPAGSDTGTK